MENEIETGFIQGRQANRKAQLDNMIDTLAGQPEAEKPTVQAPAPVSKPSLLSNLLSETWEGIKATPETAATLATGMTAWPISVIGGIGTTALKGAEAGKEMERFLSEKFTYQPKGKVAQEAAGKVGAAMEVINKPAEWLGNLYEKLTGSPEGAYFLTKTGEVATVFAFPKVGKGIKSAVAGKQPWEGTPKPGELALDKTFAEAEAKRAAGNAPGDAAALAQKEAMQAEAARAENMKVMEDLNNRAHLEVEQALKSIPESEWSKYVDTGKQVDVNELATLVENHAKRMEDAKAEMGETAKLPQVYRDAIEKEKRTLQERADNLKELAKEAEKADTGLIVVPEVLKPKETIKAENLKGESGEPLITQEKIKEITPLPAEQGHFIQNVTSMNPRYPFQWRNLEGKIKYAKNETELQKLIDRDSQDLATGKFRPINEIARDLNAILGERGAVGDLGPLSPEKQAAYERLKADFSVISRNAKRAGKNIESYLLDLGFDREVVQYIANEAQVAKKQDQPSPGSAGPPPPGPRPDIRVNLDRIEATEQVKNLIADINVQQQEAGRTAQTTRGVRSHAQTANASLKAKMSVEDLLKRKPGTIWNAEQMTAARDIRDAAAVKVQELSDKALSGDAEAAGNLHSALAIFGEIEAQRTGASAEIGRALESHKIFSEAGRQPFDPKQLGELAQAIKDSTGDPIVLAKRIKALKKPEQIATFSSQLVNALKRGSDIFTEVWINGLLSGPKTHMVNFLSNTVTAGWSIPERTVGAGYGIVSRLAGSEGGVAPAEPAHMLYGVTQGFKDALQAAARSWRTGEPTFGEKKVEGPRRALTAENLGLRPETAIGHAIDLIGEAIRTPGRALTTSDEFFKGINYRMELNAQAYREAYYEGLRGKEMAERIQQIIDNPPDSVIEKAQKFASTQTFTDALGPYARHIAGLSNVPVIGKIILPFVGTPTNILKYTWERTPGLNLISKKFYADVAEGGASRDLALAKMTMGGLVVYTALELAESGYITGQGPVDRKLKKISMDAGIQPYSVKINGKWEAFNRLDPIGNILGIAADFSTMKTDLELDEANELAAAFILSVSNTFVNKTYLQGLSQTLDAIKDPDQGSKKYLQSFMGSLVPTGVSTVNQLISPELKETNDLFDRAKSRIPGLAADMPPKRSFFGEPTVPESGAVNPIQTTTDKKDEILSEIVKQKVSIGMPPKWIGGYKPSDNPLAQESARWGVKLSPQEYDRLVVLSRKEVEIGGLTLRAQLKELMLSERYQDATEGPDGMKAALIKQWVSAYDAMGRAVLLQENEELANKLEKQRLLKINALIGGQ